VFVTLIEQLYKTGALKVDCAVLRFEHFDDTTAKQVLSREGPPSIINVPSHSGEFSLSLQRINVALSKQKVVNVPVTRIGGELGIRARGRG
jgi:hypothetical protein